jgi:CheY-like chemotaxis protein
MKKQQTTLRFKARKVCPVVAVTAFASSEVATNANSVGMSEVILKPVNINTLIEVLRKYM